MKLIVLCAGYATRLYPLTKDKPKPLLPIADKPIIEYILEDVALLSAVDGIFIVTNAKFTQAFETWKNSYKYHCPITVVNDRTTCNEDRLGAIGDIAFTIREGKIEDDVLIIAGDNLFDMNMTSFYQYAASHAPAATIAVYDVQDKELAKKYGLVEIDHQERIIDFKEKPAHPTTTLASLGVYYYPRSIMARLKQYIEEGNNPDQPGHFVAWLAKNDTVYAYAFRGMWYDIGDFKSLENADKEFRKKK